MAEARKARENAQAYRERKEELESQREIQALRSGLTTFVQTNKDAAPLTATAEDPADLVRSGMQENPENSETQALTHLEGKHSAHRQQGSSATWLGQRCRREQGIGNQRNKRPNHKPQSDGHRAEHGVGRPD